MTTTPFKMPKAGLFDAQGRLTKAGHSYLTGVENAVSARTQRFASTAEEVLEAGASAVRADGLWQTMDTFDFAGGEIFTPDLGARLDFICRLTTVTTMLYPADVPGNSRPYFSVLFIQDSVGGRPLQFDEALLGEAPEVLDGPNDMTLVGFKILFPGSYTAWTVKGIEAVV